MDNFSTKSNVIAHFSCCENFSSCLYFQGHNVNILKKLKYKFQLYSRTTKWWDIHPFTSWAIIWNLPHDLKWAWYIIIPLNIPQLHNNLWGVFVFCLFSVKYISDQQTHLCWISGEVSLLKWLCGIGISCSGKWLSHSSWRTSRNV